MRDNTDDPGFTLIELLLVITIMAILSTIVVLSVAGVTTTAEETVCEADRRMLETATEAYFARQNTDQLPDAGGDEGHEQTLVDADVLRETSVYYDLDDAGQLVLDTGSACTL